MKTVTESQGCDQTCDRQKPRGFNGVVKAWRSAGLSDIIVFRTAEVPRVLKHAGLWENFESKQYLVSNNMKEEWFVTLNFCFVKLVIVQIML